MHSWTTIRTGFAVLLLIPILHLALLVSQNVAANLNSSPTAWEDEVNDYTEAFQARERPEDPIVVIGGHRVRLWPGLEELLSPREALMIGLGDATVDDIIHYHSELVAFLQPHTVVLFPGNSEFHIRANKSAWELLESIRELIELDQTYDAARKYYVFVPLKSPLYPEDYTKIEEVADLLQGWALEQPGVTLLDANPLLALKSGAPNPNFFRFDGSNLNEHGYLRISLLLQTRLEQEEVAP